jgi:hypothetical protein
MVCACVRAGQREGTEADGEGDDEGRRVQRDSAQCGQRQKAGHYGAVGDSAPEAPRAECRWLSRAYTSPCSP